MQPLGGIIGLAAVGPSLLLVTGRHSKAGGAGSGTACEDVDGCDYPTETLIFLVVGFTLGRCKRNTPSLTVASISS